MLEQLYHTAVSTIFNSDDPRTWELVSLKCNSACIDRFHSRDRWPQWGGETIRNI